MTDAIETFTVETALDSVTVEIFPDYDCESPRGWDNVGTFSWYGHSRDLPTSEADIPYSPNNSYGRIADHKPLAFAVRCIRLAGGIAIPVQYQSQSYSRVVCGSPNEDSQIDQWANGIYWCDADTIAKEGIVDPAKYLEGEVRIYDRWLEGDCVGYVVSSPEGDHLDSCWGFIDDMDYCKSEAVSIAEWHLSQIKRDHSHTRGI